MFLGCKKEIGTRDFFHRFVITRRARNHVSCIRDMEGNVVHGLAGIGNVFVKYFKEKWGSEVTPTRQSGRS